MEEYIDRFHNNGAPTLGECVERYLAELKAQERPATTLATYRSQARLISNELRSRPVTSIRRADVREWHKQLGQRRAADGRRLTGAADHALKVLRAIYRWAQDEEIIDEEARLPTRDIRNTHKSQGAKAFCQDELERYRNALPIHEKVRTRRVRGLRLGHPRLAAAFAPTVALQLLDLTGARVSEIRTLRVEHLQLGLGMFVLSHTKTSEKFARPLSTAAIQCIRYQIARLGDPSDGFLFPGRKPGTCISDTQLQKTFGEVCKVADIVGATRRSLRTTLVTHAFRRRRPSTAIAAAVGHTREMAFERYRQALPGDAWDVVEEHSYRRSGAGGRAA